MRIAYNFFFTLTYLFYLNNMRVPLEKKPAPGDQEFNFKMCWSIALSVKCHVATPTFSFMTNLSGIISAHELNDILLEYKVTLQVH